MRNFRCVCGNTIYFENSQCLVCGRALGFLPQPLVLSPIEPVEGGRWHALSSDAPTTWRQCRNYENENVCNWMVPADDPEPFCRACRLNQLIPNLADPHNRVLWARIERAKRRLLYTLFVLKLPVIGRDRDPQHPGRRPEQGDKYAHVIEDTYIGMDKLVGANASLTSRLSCSKW